MISQLFQSFRCSRVQKSIYRVDFELTFCINLHIKYRKKHIHLILCNFLMLEDIDFTHVLSEDAFIEA